MLRPGRPRRAVRAAALFTAVAALAGTLAAPAGAATLHDDEPGDRFPLFDFTNAYYKENGIKPSALVGRRDGKDGVSVKDKSPDNRHRNVRSLFTVPAYDHSGDTVFFTVLADLAPNPFTKNAAGREAKRIAETYPVYVFPEIGGDPLGVGNSRQSDLVDMRHGYFSNDPLGLWVHVFVSYTDAAFDTPDGREALAELRERNGTAVDGTPIIATVGEIEDLEEDGFIALRKRPKTDQGRYFVCPAYKDPRDGAIAKDAILFAVLDDDGNPLADEQHFIEDFEALRDTGDWS